MRVKLLSLWPRADSKQLQPSTGFVKSLSLWHRSFEFQGHPANPLRVSRVLRRSRCGAVRISTSPGALSRTLCGFRTCRIALAVAPCEFQRRPANLVHVGTLLLSRRANFKTRRQPSAGFVRVEALSILDADREPSCCFRRVPAMAR